MAERSRYSPVFTGVDYCFRFGSWPFFFGWTVGLLFFSTASCAYISLISPYENTYLIAYHHALEASFKCYLKESKRPPTRARSSSISRVALVFQSLQGNILNLKDATVQLHLQAASTSAAASSSAAESIQWTQSRSRTRWTGSQWPGRRWPRRTSGRDEQ